MKKMILCLALIAGIAGVLALCGRGGGGTDGTGAYLRMHIRADSNDPAAQAVKYEVRDRVVEYLTPIVAGAADKEEAMARVERALGGVEGVSEAVLRLHGLDYGARAELRREAFPTRVYEGVTLEAGVYDALIVELGTGQGDNWWCVVYPPLCFTSAPAPVTYRSIILETIEKFFAK